MNVAAHHISLLTKTTEKLFHTGDLANLWGIRNRNTLLTTLKRYTKAGLLYRIYKGFYSLFPLDDLDPLSLGAKAIHAYCYLTTETVLFQEGYISQTPQFYTFVSEKNHTIRIQDFHFRSRQLKAEYLYNNEGMYTQNEVQKATPERAIADMLYFNTRYHFDKNPDWKTVQYIQNKVGYPLTKSRYGASKSY